VENSVGICIVWLALFLSVGVCQAEEKPATDAETSPTSKGKIVFESYYSIAKNRTITLANGKKVAKPENWRTIVVANVGVNPRTHLPITCTGTFVGPGVFVTAAHCLDRGASNGLQTDISIVEGTANLDVTCDVAQGYRDAVKAKVWDGTPPRVSDDFALCSFDVTHNAPPDLTGLEFEVVDIHDHVVKDSPVLMSGLGCAKLVVDRVAGILNSASDLALRIGDAVTAIPAPLDGGQNGNYLQIFSAISQPALCPGDSGGPLLTGITTDEQSGNRRIRGINSAIGQGHTDQGDVYFISKIAVLSSPSFAKLTDEWLGQDKHRVICGVNVSAGIAPCAN
jgi:Trypsin